MSCFAERASVFLDFIVSFTQLWFVVRVIYLGTERTANLRKQLAIEKLPLTLSVV